MVGPESFELLGMLENGWDGCHFPVLGKQLQTRWEDSLGGGCLCFTGGIVWLEKM